MGVQQLCGFCEKPIPLEKLLRRPNQNYCTRQCAWDARKYDTTRKKMRNCTYCTRPFSGQSYWQEYCTRDCAWAGRIEKTQKVLICDGCDKVFTCRPSEVSPGRNFHDKECFRKNGGRTKKKSLAYISSMAFVRLLIECQDSKVNACAVPWCREQRKKKETWGNNWPLCEQHAWFVSTVLWRNERTRKLILQAEGLA